LQQIIISIPNAIMSHTAHHEVISVLTELYTLLDTLAAIPPDTLRLPPADTGVHPTFNADAASEGGYSLEAVQALSALPYVYGGAIIGPSTSTNYFLRPTNDGEDFEQDREMMYDDNLAPPSAIQLTDSEGGYGCIYIYDAEKRVIFPWTPMTDQPPEDESDLDANYFHISPISPREALQPVIDMHRGLHYINRPLTGDSNFLLVTEHLGVRLPDDPTDAQRQSFERSRNIWQAEYGLKAIYLDCGWDVNALEQTNFRRNEFLQKRKDYIKNIIKPLE
jgi:hypothetical protein